MQQETEQVNKLLQSWTDLTEEQRQWVDRSRAVERFLIAWNKQPQTAFEKLKETLLWREEYKPGEELSETVHPGAHALLLEK